MGEVISEEYLGNLYLRSKYPYPIKVSLRHDERKYCRERGVFPATNSLLPLPICFCLTFSQLEYR